MLDIDLNSCGVIVSKHAQKRVVQRAGLLMNEMQKQYPKEYIEGRFRKARLNQKLESCPFYKNKLESKHGVGSFVVEDKNFSYRCQHSKGKSLVIIKSIIYKGNK